MVAEANLSTKCDYVVYLHLWNTCQRGRLGQRVGSDWKWVKMTRPGEVLQSLRSANRNPIRGTND